MLCLETFLTEVVQQQGRCITKCLQLMCRSGATEIFHFATSSSAANNVRGVRISILTIPGFSFSESLIGYCLPCDLPLWKQAAFKPDIVELTEIKRLHYH